MALKEVKTALLEELVTVCLQDVGEIGPEEVWSAIAADELAARLDLAASNPLAEAVRDREVEAKVLPEITCIWIFSPFLGRNAIDMWGRPSMRTMRRAAGVKASTTRKQWSAWEERLRRETQEDLENTLD